MLDIPAAAVDLRERIRLAIADVLRDKVIGDDADAKREEVMLAPGPRWFDESRPIRRIHSDPSMFIGGMRALLLQSLHPLAMAGVAQHSDYRNDPWGRLQRTADFLAATTFAPAEVAQRAVDRVVAVHKRVTGTASDGRAYSASDPHLLRWVHVAEVDSFLTTHRTYGSESLSEADYDGYVADMAVVARKLGVSAPPTSVKGLHDQLTMFRPELRATAESRDVTRYLLFEPPLPIPARVPYSMITAAAVASLPAWVHAELRLPWLPLTERVVLRPIGKLVANTIGWATSVDSVEPVTR